MAIFREGQGIGFAVPVKRLSEAVSEIFTPEEIKGLWLGSRFKMGSGGVVAASIEPGSPADKGGLRTGDLILRVNGQAARTPVEVNREIIAMGETQDFQLQVQRKGEHRTLTLRLVPEKEVFNASLIRQKLGVTVQELSAEAAAELGLNSTEGLLIAGVEKNSPAARSNLARGYVIRTINGVTAESIPVAAKMLYPRRPGEKVELELVVCNLRGRVLDVYPAKAEVIVR